MCVEGKPHQKQQNATTVDHIEVELEAFFNKKKIGVTSTICANADAHFSKS